MKAAAALPFEGSTEPSVKYSLALSWLAVLRAIFPCCWRSCVVSLALALESLKVVMLRASFCHGGGAV